MARTLKGSAADVKPTPGADTLKRPEPSSSVTWSVVTPAKTKAALMHMKALTHRSQKDIIDEALRQWIIANGGEQFLEE